MKTDHPLSDLDADIRDHLDRETEDNIERGMSPEEARYAALRKLGNELKRVRGMRVTPGYFQGRAYSTGRRPLLHQKGAQRLEVVWMVLGQGLRTTLIGIAIGVPAALTLRVC